MSKIECDKALGKEISRKIHKKFWVYGNKCRGERQYEEIHEKM